MKKLLSLSAFLAVALFIGAACQAASTANMTANNGNQPANNSVAPADEHAHADDAPRITLADAKKDFDAGTAIFVDTRGAASYEIEHIKGAINVSADMLEAKLKELPKDKKIIAYCS